MNNLAIIPARSGSKEVKDKNIRLLCKKPLIAYTIMAAQKSNIFSNILVSTDSELYADIAKSYGAEVPFLRSKENSTDDSNSWDVVKEVIKEYRKKEIEFDMITLLQPTSPLRNGQDILNSYEIFCNKNAKAVISVCEEKHSPLLCNTLKNDFSMENFINPNMITQRQKLDKYYRINGAIYMINTRKFEKNCNIYEKRCYAYIMRNESSIDIDSELDFKIAEALINSSLEN